MYEFSKKPEFIEYYEDEPLKLHKNLNLFHNKVKLRKFITSLQNLFKDRVGIPLDAPAIKDTYLKKEHSDKYLILLCAELEIEKELNTIINKYEKNQLKSGGHEIEVTKDFILLKSIDLLGFEIGVDSLKTIFEQTFSKYFSKNKFDRYIQIPSLSLFDKKI